MRFFWTGKGFNIVWCSDIPCFERMYNRSKMEGADRLLDIRTHGASSLIPCKLCHDILNVAVVLLSTRRVALC